MGGKTSYGAYSVTQGGVGNVVLDPIVNSIGVQSGASEPNWPKVQYATIVDGGVVWTAVYARKTKGTVMGVLNPAVFQHDRLVYPHHYFQYGVLTWLTGNNAGLTIDIRDSMGVVTNTDGSQTRPYIYGLELMPAPIHVGDQFTATVGCPKTRYACQEFNNMDNFRAFPDMPTEERALQTPNMTSSGYATPQNQK
jgi:hypothetical protein